VGKGKEASTDQKGKEKDLVGVKEREKFGKKTVRRSRNRSSKTEHLSRADASDSEDSDQPLSSSVKMKLFHSTEASLNSSDEESTGQCEATGYRLIDLQSLSSVLSAAHKCEEGEKITLTDFTKPFDCSSGLKNKPISVYNLTS